VTATKTGMVGRTFTFHLRPHRTKERDCWASLHGSASFGRETMTGSYLHHPSA
jgi:hypothetical protein